MSGGWQDEDVDGWKDGERMGRWMIGWMHGGAGAPTRSTKYPQRWSGDPRKSTSAANGRGC